MTTDCGTCTESATISVATCWIGTTRCVHRVARQPLPLASCFMLPLPQMMVKSVAGLVHVVHYRQWRQTGVAFEFGDQTYTVPNRTMATYAQVRFSWRRAITTGARCGMLRLHELTVTYPACCVRDVRRGSRSCALGFGWTS